MSTYTTPTQHTPHIEPVDESRREDAPQRTSRILLGALAVALLSLGVWWYGQRTELETTPSVTLIEPASVDPSAAAATKPDARTAARPAARSERGVVIADRAAQPRAGNPLPEYPRSALRNGEEGSVLLSISVDARGMPTDVQVVQRGGDRDRSFDRAAIEAARQWRFEPARQGGKAVPSTVQLPVDFRRG